MPLVSVALSMRNSATSIEAALRSLQLQSFDDWELLLFDDGSSDDTVHRVEALRDPRIHVKCDGERRGLAVRLNQAIDSARGRYFARMDADDIAYPKRFELQVAFLESNPNVQLLGTGMMVFEGDGKPVGLYPTHAAHEQLRATPYRGFHLAHPTWMGQMQWFHRWRYNPNYQKAQDQDLLLRAFPTSRYSVLPEPLVGYRQERLSIRKSVVGRYYFSRTLANLALSDRHHLGAIGGIAAQAAMAVYDSLCIVSGLSRRLLTHRVLPYSSEDAALWERVWRQCTTPDYGSLTSTA